MTPPATADHPHDDPGDGRTECERCGKYIWPAIHSCKGVPVTARARARRIEREGGPNDCAEPSHPGNGGWCKTCHWDGSPDIQPRVT